MKWKDFLFICTAFMFFFFFSGYGKEPGVVCPEFRMVMTH